MSGLEVESLGFELLCVDLNESASFEESPTLIRVLPLSMTRETQLSTTIQLAVVYIFLSTHVLYLLAHPYNRHGDST